MFPFNLPRIFDTVYCDEAPKSRAASAFSSVKNAVAVPESELKRWRRTFDANAKTMADGQKYMNREQFVEAIAPKGDLSKIGRSSFATLFRVADGNKRGLVSWDDFVVFETILKRPDADYWIAFQYFDVDESGTIDYDEFKNVFNANIGPDAIPFDFDCDWVKLYLGKKNGAHVLGYNEFTQLMKGLQGERLRQAFKYLDKDQDGYIRPEQFKKIILDIAGHKLSDAVIERLPTLTTLTPGGRISYSEVIAFYNVIREMDMVERIIREASAKTKDRRIDQSDFLNYCVSSSRYSLFTPMEASIIFHFAGRGNSAQRIAGGVGASMVYPIDLVKVRLRPEDSLVCCGTDGERCTAWACRLGAMQNQRSTVVGQLLYKNSLDCVRKVFRNEGLVGFYRGLGPQLIGVAPEKAIKLTVNDFVRSRAMDPETGRITLPWELFAGGSAGGCQVVFTNPLEIVKIRLQVQGEAAKVEGAAPKGAVHIIRQLGLLGLYKGASACLLRDIPFSAIYFPAYNHLKKDVFNEGYNGKQLSFLETLTAAAAAGMPAAYFTTPADVVKTRLQVEARSGQTHYKGLVDAFAKIYREEGFKAFFKGGPARIIRSSPQFGPSREVETTLTSQREDMAQVRARNALRILLDVHGDFGRRA
ncbi:mitochondrial inner membrane protein [Epithele typhae]|uniref:mitochondrial inner membrane protein n=1 Tax=Epithele typhae TaxID=378194 RepID=UPI002007B622|nr:mitochondrial inner membrane protein [Epithele typhae]KAH9920237.1 mitochondrial inner membrane protein [Epithele typhae]